MAYEHIITECVHALELGELEEQHVAVLGRQSQLGSTVIAALAITHIADGTDEGWTYY